MNSIILILFVIMILLFFSAFVAIFWNDIVDIVKVRNHHRKHDKLLIDYYLIDNPVITKADDKKNPYKPIKTWTNEPDENIFFKGYYEGEKWMDQLRYIFIPVYVRFHNFKVAESDNLMSSSALYDFYNSKATDNFMANLTKIQFAPMDIKAMGVMIPVIIGIAIGVLWFFGVI